MESFATLIAMQLGYMLLAAAVGFGCGYMFRKEQEYKKPDRKAGPNTNRC